MYSQPVCIRLVRESLHTVVGFVCILARVCILLTPRVVRIPLKQKPADRIVYALSLRRKKGKKEEAPRRRRRRRRHRRLFLSLSHRPPSGGTGGKRMEKKKPEPLPPLPPLPPLSADTLVCKKKLRPADFSLKGKEKQKKPRSP